MGVTPVVLLSGITTYLRVFLVGAPIVAVADHLIKTS
jgi:hypothetical protein